MPSIGGAEVMRTRYDWLYEVAARVKTMHGDMVVQMGGGVK